MKLVSLALSLLSLSAFAEYKKKVTEPVIQSSSGTIQLTPLNTITIRGAINGSSASKFIEELANNKASEVFVVLDTPGGSVIDGQDIVNAIQASGKTVSCVVKFAASMGFSIFQACDNRYVTNNTILMQHQPSWSVRHQAELNAVSFVNFLTKMTSEMNADNAKRMGLSTAEFSKMILSDLWIYGSEAEKKKAADKTVSVACTAELISQSESIAFQTMFGDISVEFSRCPLISNIRKITKPSSMYPGNTPAKITKWLSSFDNMEYVKENYTLSRSQETN